MSEAGAQDLPAQDMKSLWGARLTGEVPEMSGFLVNEVRRLFSLVEKAGLRVREVHFARSSGDGSVRVRADALSEHGVTSASALFQKCGECGMIAARTNGHSRGCKLRLAYEIMDR